MRERRDRIVLLRYTPFSRCLCAYCMFKKLCQNLCSPPVGTNRHIDTQRQKSGYNNGKNSPDPLCSHFSQQEKLGGNDSFTHSCAGACVSLRLRVEGAAG